MNQTVPFNNPVIEQRADPWIYKHSDGYYYFTGSVPEYDRIEVRRASTIQGLSTAEPVAVWHKYETGPLSANIWAPEIHYINDKWYIYFAAARTTETKEGLFDHRMFVLENDSANPLEGNGWKKDRSKPVGRRSLSMRQPSSIMEFCIMCGLRRTLTSSVIPICIFPK